MTTNTQPSIDTEEFRKRLRALKGIQYSETMDLELNDICADIDAWGAAQREEGRREGYADHKALMSECLQATGNLDAAAAMAAKASAVPSAFGIPEPSPRDWREDFAHENGNYACKCSTCGMSFFGHKRRITCKVCAAPQPQEAVIVGNSFNGRTPTVTRVDSELAEAIKRGGSVDNAPPLDRPMTLPELLDAYKVAILNGFGSTATRGAIEDHFAFELGIVKAAYGAEKARADEAEEWLNTEKEFSHAQEQRAVAAESSLAFIRQTVCVLQRYGFDGTFGGDFGKQPHGCYIEVDSVLALLQPQNQESDTSGLPG